MVCICECTIKICKALPTPVLLMSVFVGSQLVAGLCWQITAISLARLSVSVGHIENCISLHLNYEDVSVCACTDTSDPFINQCFIAERFSSAVPLNLLELFMFSVRA